MTAHFGILYPWVVPRLGAKVEDDGLITKINGLRGWGGG